MNFNGAPNFAKSGMQLGSNMMIIQLVDISPSEYGDKFGGITPKTKVVGSGTAYLLRDGSVTEVTWNRETPNHPHLGFFPMAKLHISLLAKFGYFSPIGSQ